MIMNLMNNFFSFTWYWFLIFYILVLIWSKFVFVPNNTFLICISCFFTWKFSFLLAYFPKMRAYYMHIFKGSYYINIRALLIEINLCYTVTLVCTSPRKFLIIQLLLEKFSYSNSCLTHHNLWSMCITMRFGMSKWCVKKRVFAYFSIFGHFRRKLFGLGIFKWDTLHMVRH